MSQGYVFDQAWKEERARLAGIEAIWDPGSQRVISALGIGPGWQVLEIGGGGGRLVEWLADRVGPTGRVVATDIDPRFLLAVDRPNVEVLRHDVVADKLPDGRWDLIHLRLVLEHLPQREQVLDGLAAALAPRGVLLVEDYDWAPHTVHPPSAPVGRVIDAARGLMQRHGYDPALGRALVGALRQRLQDVEADGRLALIDVDAPGAAAFTLSLEQLGPGLVDAGVLTPDDLAGARADLQEPGRLIVTPAMIAAWGRAG